jgi:hypothetical protein
MLRFILGCQNFEKFDADAEALKELPPRKQHLNLSIAYA